MYKLLVFAKDDCPTCLKLINELKNSNIDYELFYKTRKNKDIFMKYSIMVAPTTILVENEIEIDRFYGAKDIDFIEKFVKGEI